MFTISGTDQHDVGGWCASDLTDDLHATSILPMTLYTDSLQPADGTQVHIQYERSVLHEWNKTSA